MWQTEEELTVYIGHRWTPIVGIGGCVYTLRWIQAEIRI